MTAFLLLNREGPWSVQGAWDDAKKLSTDAPSDSAHNLGKGWERHKAGAVGGTVGDPLKDTGGPALNSSRR